MKNFKSQSVWVAVGVLVLGAGCKGSDSADAAPTASATAGTPAPAGGAVTSVSGDKYADVQKITTANCVSCHGAQRPPAGIDLSSYDTIMKGGRKGPIVAAGDPDSSLIYKAVTGAAGVRKMPPKGNLDAASIQTISAWIKAGAKND
jgi:mono/diheme cytochrome c family protein